MPDALGPGDASGLRAANAWLREVLAERDAAIYATDGKVGRPWAGLPTEICAPGASERWFGFLWNVTG